LQGGFARRYLGKEGSATNHHQFVASTRDGDVETVGVVQKRAGEVIGIRGSHGKQHDIALRSLQTLHCIDDRQGHPATTFGKQVR